MINFYKILTRSKKEDPKKLLVRIYKDQNGHIYYRFKDVRQLPAARLRVAEKCMTEADLSITAEDGTKLIKLAIEKFETATRSKKFEGFAEGISILVELAKRFEALLEEKTLLNVATVYFTIDDEDPNTYLSSYQEKKKDAWDMDNEAKNFFLCRGAETTGYFSNTSDADILTYLKKEQPGLEKATDFLSKYTRRTISAK